MIRFFYPSWILFLCLNAFSCSSAGQTEKAPSIDSSPTYRQLKSYFHEKRAITVVYGSQQEELALAYRAVLADLPNSGRRFKIEVKSDRELEESDWSEEVLYLIGTPQSNSILAQIADQLPVRFGKGQFQFANREFVKEDGVLQLAFYPNPLQPQIPVNVLTGVSDQSIIQHLHHRKKTEGSSNLSLRWNYAVYQNKHRVMIGDFSEQSWTVDQKVHFDFSRTDTVATSPHFHFIAHQKLPADFDVQQLVNNCEARYQQMAEWIRPSQSLQKSRITYHIYGTAEDKGLITNNTAQAHYDFSNQEVHTVINEQFAQNFIEKENNLLIQNWLGLPKTDALLDGLSICFSKQWQQKGYQYWAARLQVSGNAMTLRDLLDNRAFQQESWLIKSCMAGVLVDFLVEEFGPIDFLKHYSNWTADQSTIDQLQNKWDLYLNQLVKTTNAKKPLQANNRSFPFLKGFNFAHEGYSIYDGYLSRKASQSLKRLADLGTNAVSIIPYSYMRDPKKAVPIPFIERAGTENDESVIHSAFTAKQLGMTTLLKPQVWISGSWPGAITMSSEAEWQQFFDYYYRWIRHYALLAEIHQIDLLCVGVEFSKATQTHEQEWRTIFRKLRGLYSGPLTYCANWGNEFEKITFWDELDYIGLSCYYPLSHASKANEATLQKGFNKVLSKIKSIQQKHQKPVLLTEIGFRSVDQTWQKPHAEADGRKVNEQDQALCYKVVFKGLENQDWCHGLFWWKWPSYLEYDYPVGYSPNEKAAEQVLKEWFGRSD